MKPKEEKQKLPKLSDALSQLMTRGTALEVQAKPIKFPPNKQKAGVRELKVTLISEQTRDEASLRRVYEKMREN